MAKIKIDDNVPVEKNKAGAKSIYEFHLLEVGQSRWIKANDISLIRSAAGNFSRRNGITLETSKEKQNGKNGIRVWRTA